MATFEGKEARTLEKKQGERTEQQKQLENLIDSFVSCMQADLKSQEHLDLGKKFNRLLDSYLQEYQNESIATFALRVSKWDSHMRKCCKMLCIHGKLVAESNHTLDIARYHYG
jgi:uncharacterized protein YukE